MFKNYLKVAFRNLFKQSGYSFINVFGLGLGIACCMLIFLFIRNEFSYDAFHKNADRIYRVALRENPAEDRQFFNTVTPFLFGPTLTDYFPDISRYARVATITDVVRNGDISFSERYHLVDPSFLQMFTFPLIKGDIHTALENPNSVILTRSMAQKYFGDVDPMGQPLSIKIKDEMQSFTVTGIAQDVPPNSSIQFNFLLPMQKAHDIWSERALSHWFIVISETYIQLKETAEISELEAKVPSLVKNIMGDEYHPGVYNLLFQPLKEIHLNTNYPSGLEPTSNPVYSYILSGIALLVLFIACVNFITLSIGRSATRAREVGVRKVVGAGRNQLMKQFWGESLLLSLLALLLGVGLTELFLPTFNALANKKLMLNFDGSTYAMFLGLVVLIGFIAGSYPAAVLSQFRPVEVLKGKMSVRKMSWLRQGLVVFQFVISIVLIVSTLLMSKQLDFIRTRNLGFDREQVVVIGTNANRDEGHKLIERYRNELIDKKNIVNISGSMHAFGEGWTWIGFNANDGRYRNFWLNAVDYEFLDLMDIKLAQGRKFSRQYSTDFEQAVIVNETFVKEFDLGNPIGKQLPGNFPEHSIIGVVKDFNFKSLHDPIEPLVLVMNPNVIFRGASDVSTSSSRVPKVSVKVKPDNLPATIALLEKSWQKLFPSMPFKYSFLDDVVDRQYHAEERWRTIITYSSEFAILIACLGLFGLASLAVARRTKEIGIRKVLGATETNIVILLSKEYTLMVIIANLVAWPLAYFVMKGWLQDFAYRIHIDVGIFAIAGLIALTVALLTVSFHSLKASMTNPVKTLRYE